MDFVRKTGKCLGSGAKGTVYLAYDEETGGYVAVKELFFSVDDVHEEAAKDIMNEIRLLKKANHENLIRYVGVRRSGARIEIGMEYVSGGSIRSVLKRHGTLRESVVRNYARDILQGLAYLHDVCKVCHRDIKPDNVLVTPEGRCKLADYGASRSIEKTMLMNSCIGTSHYMAPEVILGAGYDHRADIWSYGITVYEMAVGKPPFAQVENPMAVMFKIANTTAPIDIPTNLSPLLREFLALCLERDTTKRPTADELLRHAWFTSTITGSSSPPPVAHVGHPEVPTAPATMTTASTVTSDASSSSPQTTTGPQTAAEDFPFFEQREREPKWQMSCEECRSAPAMLSCDECRAGGVPHCNLCVMCWSVAHQHPRGASHVKRPFLFQPRDATEASHNHSPSHTTNNNNNNNNKSQSSNHAGLLLADGNFVDLCCTGEQSEWTCGRCQTLNDGPLPNCTICGYER